MMGLKHSSGYETPVGVCIHHTLLAMHTFGRIVETFH